MRKEEAAGGGKAGAHARCGGGGGAKWRGRMRAAGRRGFGAWAHAQWLRRAAPPEGAAAILCVHPPTLSVMALVSADSRIAELLGELHQLIKQTQVSGWGHTLTRKNLGGGGAAILPPPIPTPRYVPPPYRRRSAPAASTTWSTSRKRTRGCRRRIRVRGSGGRGTHRDISPLPTRIGVWGLLPEPPPPTPVFLLSLSLLPDQAAGALHHGQG